MITNAKVKAAVFPHLAECHILKACSDLLKAECFHVHRLQAGFVRGGTRGTPMTIGEKGQPDLLAMKAGFEPFYVECKTLTGRISADQIAWHEGAARRGFKVLVIRDVAELRKELALVRRCS